MYWSSSYLDSTSLYSNMYQEPAASESKNAEPNSNKYLSCAYCIWKVTKQKLASYCCCCLAPADTGSRKFIWMLFRQNAWTTLAYFFIYLVFGMCIGFLGPTLEDLACFTGEPVKAISWAFFAQSCTMVIGIWFAGFVSRW